MSAMLAQVNISGLRAATDTNRQTGRRLVWVFLLIVCFAVMVAQITDRVRHFLSEPVSVQVSVARNNSLLYPAVTVCNKNMFNVTAMRKLLLEAKRKATKFESLFDQNSLHGNQTSRKDGFSFGEEFGDINKMDESFFSSINSSLQKDVAALLSLSDLNAHKLWLQTAHDRKKLIKECWFGRNVTCDKRGQWSLALTSIGVCHTYALNDSLVHLAGIFHNLYLRLEETESDHYDGDSGWYVYIHHAAERPTLGVRTHGTSLYPGQGRDLRLDMKKIHALSHTRNLCHDNDPSYFQSNCFVECFMTRLSKENLTCRLPYMTDADFGSLPYCWSPESYRHSEKLVNALFFYGQWTPNQCLCPKQCLKYVFTSSLESTTDSYKVKRLHPRRTQARIRVYYQNLEFEYIREEVGYGTIDLLCDVGGTLSLLMGASLLTCCELLEVAWIYLLQKCCVLFPTAGPALNNVAKFLMPIATNDPTIISEINPGSNNINNASLIIQRRESDAAFPTKLNKGSVTIAMQASSDDNIKIGTLPKNSVNGTEKQYNTRKCKLSQIKSDLNDKSSEHEIVSVLYIDGDSNTGTTGDRKNSKKCTRRAISCKTRNNLTQTQQGGSNSSVNLGSASSSRGNTHRPIARSPSADDSGYKTQGFSISDHLQGHAQVQTPETRNKNGSSNGKDFSTCSENETETTRYLFHHFPPSPSSEAQKFYRDVANGGEPHAIKPLSTSYVHKREVPKPFYCSKPPPSPNLYIVQASTGPSLSTAYLPNGNAIASRSTVSSSTSTPIGGSTSQKYYCQKTKSASKYSSGATTIRSSTETLNTTKSNRKEKGLHVGSEELIV